MPIEFFKEMDADLLDKLADLLNTWWNDPSTIPERLTDADMTLIHKNKGDPNDCSNYRPIALLNSIYKIYVFALFKIA